MHHVHRRQELQMTRYLCRSRRSVEADRLKNRAAEFSGAVSSASSRAGQTATQLAQQARDAAVHAKAWAAPRAEKAWYESRKATAPKVERAAEMALPLVDRTHDRLVDDLLPKLVAAVNAAAAATAVGADRARDATAARLTDLAHIPVPEPKKSRTGAKIFWSIAGLAVAGAVVAVFRRSRPMNDPWAEEPWETAERDLKARAAEELGDAADTVGQTAGLAVARTREASEKVAERAREATRKATARRKEEEADAAAAPAALEPKATTEPAATKPAPKPASSKPASSKPAVAKPAEETPPPA
jgi:phosphohistidine phosphatase SixA